MRAAVTANGTPCVSFHGVREMAVLFQRTSNGIHVLRFHWSMGDKEKLLFQLVHSPIKPVPYVAGEAFGIGSTIFSNNLHLSVYDFNAGLQV